MKKIVYILVATLVLTGCSISRNSQADNFKRLTIGMSKGEVEYWIGPPELYLSVTRTPYGIEEVLQYRNIYNELFALEFVNDYLVSADYIHSGAWYPMYPVANRPPHGKPVFPSHYKPNKPAPSRPPANTNRPSGDAINPSDVSGRPSGISNRPSIEERPSGTNNRPAVNERPSQNGSTTRPSTNTRPATNTNSRPSSSRENSSGSSRNNDDSGSSSRNNSR